ncbi:MAG: hypothetical protein AB3N64_10690 [Puniceicoccaceae bacterium]
MNKGLASTITLSCLLIPWLAMGSSRMMTDHGYENLIELDNGTCRVVLEPNMGGRVLNYQFQGVEVLYQDPEQAGLRPDKDEWVPLIAGGRFDFGPSFYQRPRGTLWQGEWKGEITGELSARLTSQVDPDCGVQLIREFTLAEEGTHLRCEQTIINHTKDVLWTMHWSRTMAVGGGIAYAPIPDQGHFPKGYALNVEPHGAFNFIPEEEPDVRIRDGVLEFLKEPSAPKTIFNLDEAWMAYLTRDDILFVKTFPFDPEWRYGDPPQHHASYWWKGERATEFEPNGPLEQIPPGGRASFHEDWWLGPFPFPEDKVVNIAKLRQAVADFSRQP